MSKSPAFTQEKQLATSVHEKLIKGWWQQGTFKQFTSAIGGDIHYCYFTHALPMPSIVISPGRCEGYLKYQELAYDLFHQGFNLFIIDHRGQGLSTRLLNNPEKGYVEQFDDYAHDLHQFITDIVTPALQSYATMPLHILAHSMGSAIAIRMAQLHQIGIASITLSAPMIRVSSGVIPLAIAHKLVSFSDKLNHLFSQIPWYFIGQKDYRARSFSANHLTSSSIRYQKMVTLYEQVPQLKLGGVTIHWLTQAINAEQAIFSNINQINTPIKILQAGNDGIVCNQAQTQFCQQLHQQSPSLTPAKPQIINGAKHELLFEQDVYRNESLNAILAWIKQHQ